MRSPTPLTLLTLRSGGRSTTFALLRRVDRAGIFLPRHFLPSAELAEPTANHAGPFGAPLNLMYALRGHSEAMTVPGPDHLRIPGFTCGAIRDQGVVGSVPGPQWSHSRREAWGGPGRASCSDPPGHVSTVVERNASGAYRALESMECDRNVSASHGRDPIRRINPPRRPRGEGRGWNWRDLRRVRRDPRSPRHGTWSNCDGPPTAEEGG